MDNRHPPRDRVDPALLMAKGYTKAQALRALDAIQVKVMKLYNSRPRFWLGWTPTTTILKILQAARTRIKKR